jgi:3,4-dihydroxy 2-butanone 4-phosphate synthase/GTP cyclohydrolase II
MSQPSFTTDSVDTAIARFRNACPVIIAADGDDAHGDVIIPGQLATPELALQLINLGGGVVYSMLPVERCDALGLPLQVTSRDVDRTEWPEARVSVDASHGTTTGVSAADRAVTIRALSDPDSRPDELAAPGHVVPFGALPGGTIERPRFAEGAVDLARLAGLWPGAGEAEILNPDGSRAQGADLVRVAEAHDMPIVRISDIAAYRLQRELRLSALEAREVTLPFGTFVAHSHRGPEHRVHTVLVPVRSDASDPGVIEIASSCPVAAFASGSCACSQDTMGKLRRVADLGGAVLCLDIGLGKCPPADGPPSWTATQWAIAEHLLKAAGIDPREATARSPHG